MQPLTARASVARTNVQFGGAVYGSFLVASVVGVSFEAGQDARVMTTTAFASALVFWLAHWWSEVIGEQISAGKEFRRRAVWSWLRAGLFAAIDGALGTVLLLLEKLVL